MLPKYNSFVYTSHCSLVFLSPSGGGKYCLGERKRYRSCNTDVSIHNDLLLASLRLASSPCLLFSASLSCSPHHRHLFSSPFLLSSSLLSSFLLSLVYLFFCAVISVLCIKLSREEGACLAVAKCWALVCPDCCSVEQMQSASTQTH